MRARHPLLGVREHLLGELLAGPQAGVADLDIRQLQLLGVVADQIHDLHRLAHVEHERLGVFRHGRRLEHQAHGFLDRHEEPGDIRVGHGDRLGPGYLVGQHGQERPPAAQDVAEPDGGQRHRAAGRALDDQFGQPLAGAEHRDRIGRLVGGDEDETAGAVPDRGLEHVLGAVHVGLHGLARMAFQQRQVLVRGRVEDQVGPDGGEDLIDPALVADVGDDDLVGVEQAVSHDLQLEPVQVGLVVVQQVERLGPETAGSGGTARCRSIRPPR